jgi:hypothetical protein
MQKDRRANIKKILTAFAVLGGVFSLSTVAQAQLQRGAASLQKTADAAGIAGATDLPTIIGRIIYVALGFVGIVLLVILIYAGFLWMTSGGDVEKITTAKKWITNAIIGLVIIASAWSIVYFILQALMGATGGGGITGGGTGPGGVLVGSSGSLGGGIIEYHLPERNATDVPRNTPVIITFKRPIAPASFIAGWTDATSGTTVGLNSDTVQVFRTGDEGTALTSAQARVTFTRDHKTFVIRPVDLLGSSTVNVKYSVKLKGGNAGILLESGGPALTGSFGNGYEWGFEVSTFVDLTPPKVVAAIPYAGGQYARNVVIQITFNEAVDPVGASGIFQGGSGFTNVAVRPNAGVGTPLDGEFKITNQYRTIEFLTFDKCGVNSCGKDVFCLPADSTLEVAIKSATLSSQPPQAQFTAQGFDGITDVVGNSLDGNANEVAEGPPIDDHTWSFGTSNAIKLTPPKIQETVPDASPGAGQSNRPLDENVTANFDGLMQASTFTSDAASIKPKGPGETDPDTFYYFVGMSLLTSNNTPVQPGDVAVKAQLVIKHRPYLPSTPLPDPQAAYLNYYNPFLLSDIQDAYQNCFNPASSNACTGEPNCCNNTSKGQECSFTP